MLMDVLRNTRLLERFAIFNGIEDDVPGVPGTPEYLFLSVLKSLRAGALDTAKAQYNELAAVLSVPLDSQQLEPLRTILHLKLWDGSTEDKQQLQNFLTKELRLKFEADVLRSIPAQPTPLTGAGNEPTSSPPCDTPQLPTHITPDLYSSTAFRKLLHPDNVPPKQPLTAQYDPSRLSEVVAEGSIPIQQRAVLLQQGRVPPAALSVEVLTRIFQEWLTADAERGWHCKDAFEWVKNGWNDVTAEQACALRAILPGPSFGSNPTVDKPYIVALVTKALAGPAAAAAAAASGPGVAEPAPWACGAAHVAAATELERILEVCDKLGPAAEWIRLHAVHAQLLLQQMQQAAVDMSLYIEYMKMLGRATWSPGPTVTDNRFGTQQQQQQPMHLPCNVCGMRPIAGPRFRSLSQSGFNTCVGCVRSSQAADAAPMEEVRVDDSIYMSPEVPLPPVLGVVSPNESEREAEARNMLLELVQADGAAGNPELFSPDGECPLAAAGLLLPREWRNKAVAEGKLLSGQGNGAAWSRLCQESKGKVEELRQRSELAFAAHNKESYPLQEEVVLDLITKNNGQQGVLVKLYEINCWNYYTIERKAIDLNLELSGLTPTKTIHINAPEDPITRCRHSIPLGLAGRAGVWLAEVVAGGTRVRARIYKGAVRLVQRPSVAGQVLTIVDEDWRPVKGVRIWCDNQEYKNKPDGKPNEVLLPYSRDVRSTSLVVAATLSAHDKAGAPSGGARAGTTADIAQATECVTLFEGFRRLKEQYSLHGQLYCNPESLLPGQAVPLLLQLSLQLHGRSAPLKLLQEVTLRVTAATHDGAEVTQVFKDLTVDPATGELKLQYNLPPAARQLSAVLTARILLTLPGTNGEPAYQDFGLNQLFIGRHEAAASISINAAAANSSIWDVYLSVQAGSRRSSEPEYVLQVLGRAGEAPAVPKVLSISMTHVQYSPQQEVQFRVQTGPGGVVRLGPLSGVRQIDAQIAGGLDCVEGFTGTTSHAALGRFGSTVRSRAEPGPVRKWQIARTSWWQSRLQREYTIAAGTDLEIPLTTALGQTLDPKLLQLLQQGKASSYSTSPFSQVVVADISSEHLLVTPANAAAGAAGSSSSAATGAMLGTSGTAVLRVRGLAPGRYRLLVPALLLDPPDQISQGAFGNTGVNPTAGAIHIHVLPAIQAAAAAVQDAPAAATSADAGSSSSAQQAAASPSWLWAGSSQLDVPAVITQPSALTKLHIMSLSCSTTSGLSVQLTGTLDQIESARIVAVFGRFLSDSSGVSSDMLYDTAALGSDSMAQSAQTCGGFGVCDYSRAAKLDSAVAYVLQRRQWEAEARRGGGIRPGSLLDRPSLLVVPVCKKSAASGTSVLRGGDGQRLHAKKKQMHPHPPMFGASATPAFGCAVSAAYNSIAPRSGFGELECGLTGSYPGAQSPVLSFLLNPGVVLMDLEVDVDTGLVSVSAQELQQLLTAAVGPHNAAPGGTEAGLAVMSSYSHVYVAAYVPQERGQFSSARCVVQGAVSAEQMTQPSGRRDLGLMRTVQEDDILALSCDVLALQPGASLTLPSDPAAAEAAIYSTSQQFYQLLAGLLEISEAAWSAPSYGGGYCSVARRGVVAGALQSAVGDTRAVKHLLPRPCPPPNAGGSNNSELLRQWEPLLLQWPQLSGPDRLELLDKLNSSEAAFYLACRDTQAFQQLILPLLRSKLPSELTCLEQILLLQATHNQPAIPIVSTTTRSTTTGHELTTVYDSAKQQLLQHLYAPHRYQRLTALEQVMLAALDGPAALMDLSRDMRASLKTPEERRGVKKTWMSPDRRALFDYALLLSKQLEQQQGQEQQQAQELQQQQQATGGAEYVSLDGFRFDSQCAVLPTESDDYVHVEYADLQQQQQVICGAPAPVPPPPAAAFPGSGTLAMGVPKPQMLMRERAAADESDLAARTSVAAAAMKSARLAPKETQEWAEAGWWKWDGQQTPPDLIPVSHFWADFAEHLATKHDQPFVPTDPTGTAASTAAIVAALAVIGQTHGAGLPVTSAAAAADSSSIGCSKVNNGSTVMLTATSPCLLWIKRAKSVASIAAAAAATAGSSGPVPPAAQPAVTAGPAGAVVVQGGTSSVLVTERLYDPRFASTTDPETGEQLLLALLPSEQQPLLAGQSYCQSVIITSTGAAEQHLDILVQIPQGSLPLSDSPSTISVSITLAPYATHTLDMSFYFPQAGVYKRAPASVTKRGRPAWLPVSSPSPLYVADRPEPTAFGMQQQQVAKLFNWSDFLKTASRDDILEYLSTGDLPIATLGDLSPYCKDRAFFTAATSALSKRHTYNSDIWKWAVAHMDGTTLQQMLPMSGLAQTAFGSQLPVAHLPLMQTSGHDIGVWQLEYWPWVNPYCRPIPRDDGGDSNLPSVLTDNPSIAEQWRSFLLASLFDFSNSTSSKGLSLAQATSAAVYLLLQDRVDEAEDLLRQVDLEAAAAALEDGAPLRMQVDYLRAWMALCRPVAAAGELPTSVASALALGKCVVERYKKCASQAWRKRFSQLNVLVRELEQQQAAGGAASVSEGPDITPEDTAAMLSIISCESGQLKFQHRGLSNICLSAYQIDTELLFTTQPFSSLSSSNNSDASGKSRGIRRYGDDGSNLGLGKVAYVRPSARVELSLTDYEAATADDQAQAKLDPTRLTTVVYDVDEMLPELKSQSVLLELSGGGISRTVPRFGSRLVVHITESQGILQACYAAESCTSSGGHVLLPATATYVKVFARDASGDEWFYKDGYTDLRGKFDYVTLTSTADMSRVSRFSLLVASPELGAVMQQAAPLPRQ